MWRILSRLFGRRSRAKLRPNHNMTASTTTTRTTATSETAEHVLLPRKIRQSRHFVRWGFFIIMPFLLASAYLLTTTTSNKFKFVRRPLVSLIRFVRTICYGALISADYKLSLAGLKEDSPKYQEKLKRIHLRSAKRLLRLSQIHSGLYIKMGQYIAANSIFVPKEYTDTLKVLQDQAPYRDYATVQRVFQEDFGKPIEAIFKEFDKKPLAAASLAQVHRAVTHDGREVAVKIQYPELQEQFDGDMITNQIVLKCVAWLFPKYDFKWTSEYMRNVLSKELNFKLEGLNAERAAKNISNSEDAYVPKVYWDLTSPRVLTMEFIHGIKITDKEKILKEGFNPSEILTKMMNVLGEQVFVHGFFHADPHPGNIFVRRHPKTNRSQIVLLDHGLYSTLPEKFRILWCKMYRALVLHDLEEFKQLSEQIGIKNWEILGMMILFRPIVDGQVGMRGRVSKERLRNLIKQFSKQTDEFVAAMRQLPVESLLLFRNQNLIRFINHDYGAPVNRFTIFARLAVKGLHNDKEHGTFVLKRLQARFAFEYRIYQHEFIYWLSGLWRDRKSVV